MSNELRAVFGLCFAEFFALEDAAFDRYFGGFFSADAVRAGVLAYPVGGFGVLKDDDVGGCFHDCIRFESRAEVARASRAVFARCHRPIKPNRIMQIK